MDFKNFFLRIDATDIQILEPSPFIPSWSSYKLHAPGLIYEVRVRLPGNKLMWVNGSFCPGKCNDLQIFCAFFQNFVDDGERVCRDKSYSDCKYVKNELTLMTKILCC